MYLNIFIHVSLNLFAFVSPFIGFYFAYYCSFLIIPQFSVIFNTFIHHNKNRAIHDISQVALKYFNHKTQAKMKMIKTTF